MSGDAFPQRMIFYVSLTVTQTVSVDPDTLAPQKMIENNLIVCGPSQGRNRIC